METLWDGCILSQTDCTKMGLIGTRFWYDTLLTVILDPTAKITTVDYCFTLNIFSFRFGIFFNKR